MAILSQTARWKGAVIQPKPMQKNAFVASGAYRHWALEMRIWQAEQLALEDATRYDQPHFLYQPTDVLPQKPKVEEEEEDSTVPVVTSGITVSGTGQQSSWVASSVVYVPPVNQTPQLVGSETGNWWEGTW